MNFPIVVVHEAGKRLGERLLVACPERRWILCQVRAADECVAALPVGVAAVAVVEMGRRARDLELLDRIRVVRPMAAVVVVMDQIDPGLDRICRELGAVEAFSSPRAFVELPATVEALVRSQWDRKGTVGDVISRVAALG